MSHETLTENNTTNTYDGLEVECPDCNRVHFAHKIVRQGTRECKCGTTLGPIELHYE